MHDKAGSRDGNDISTCQASPRNINSHLQLGQADRSPRPLLTPGPFRLTPPEPGENEHTLSEGIDSIVFTMATLAITGLHRPGTSSSLDSLQTSSHLELFPFWDVKDKEIPTSV